MLPLTGTVTEVNIKIQEIQERKVSADSRSINTVIVPLDVVEQPTPEEKKVNLNFNQLNLKLSIKVCSM